MQTKLLEIRDSGTFMPFLAIKLSYENEEERWLLRRAGFSPNGISGYEHDSEKYILFHPLCTDQINYDVYSWNRGARTVPLAHIYVIDHWNELKSGDVIDVEFNLGETKEKKISERLDNGY